MTDNNATVFPFYKHLMKMECRKDIHVENDFTNKKVKKGNVKLFDSLQDKIKNNKYRIAYFFSFCFIFNLNAVYDYIFFTNPIYTKTIDFILKDRSMESLKQQKQTKIDLNKEQNARIGQLFLKYDKLKSQKWQQITSSEINLMFPHQTKKYEKDYVNINEFIHYLNSIHLPFQDIKRQLQNREPSLRYL